MPRMRQRSSWQQRGFESQGAAQAARQQFGLIQTEPGGKFKPPTMAGVQRQFSNPESPNYRPTSPSASGQTPLDIGGARWNFNNQTGSLDFTGQQSDRAGGSPYTAAKQQPYQFGQQTDGGGGRQRPRGFQTPPAKVGMGGQQGMPHNQIGQMGKGAGQRQRPRRQPPEGPGMPGFGGAAGAGSVGGFPELPKAPPNFLPNTPGFEQAQGQALDTLAGAEGQYAIGKTMIPAQLGLQGARLQTDQDVATDRLREDLANRGIFTPYGASGYSAAGTSPAGGGVGQALYNRNVATPFGRQRQDLGAAGAGAYSDLSGAYGGAQLGYNQDMYQALLGRANDAFSAMPLSAQMGGYALPDMAMPSFSAPPQSTRPGRTRPRKPRGRKPGGRKK